MQLKMAFLVLLIFVSPAFSPGISAGGLFRCCLSGKANAWQPQPQSARTVFVQSARIRKAGWFRIPVKVRIASAGILGCRAASLDQDRF